MANKRLKRLNKALREGKVVRPRRYQPVLGDFLMHEKAMSEREIMDAALSGKMDLNDPANREALRKIGVNI